MTSSGTDSQVPAAPIASPSSGDSSTALFAQLNINGNNEVAAAAPVVTIAAPTASPVIDSTVHLWHLLQLFQPHPVTTTPPAIVAATVTHTQAHCGVIYITPEPNSAGPSTGSAVGVTLVLLRLVLQAVDIHLCDRDVSTMYERFSRLVNHFEINAGCSHWEIEMLEHFKYKLSDETPPCLSKGFP
ncbi:uncharacterized protein EDB91DRAFT_1082831 [Suillus paluster]|uniref:uncharacterized protein n=1 Tax=Suillus paluster TaxID=48578 RepID=UPI001B860959|nr:uncharacterized protein EDB91DRAFT_1082831 [Suillus paluster]KAG1738454.1 hypothetical protein EDB91DRAFT_1082831 [Suillus paluster]